MPPSWTQTVDNLFTSTWSLRRKEAIEQAFLKTPFAFWLKEKGRIEHISGYTRIEIPLDYASNETIRWIGKGDTVPIQDKEFLTMAYEEWKSVAVSIPRYGIEDQRNRGQAQVIRLIESRINAAERALWEDFERVFFADGTGDKEPNGLRNIVADLPTSGTLHGIDRAVYPWFRNQYKAATGSFAIYGLSDMRTLLNTCLKYSKAEIQDIVIVTDQNCYEYYEDEVLEMKRSVNQTLADAGFENIQFKGRPIFWSPFAPSAKMYFINTQYLKLITDEEYFMQMTEWKPIPDQVNDRVCQILCTQNLISSRPVVHGVLHTITA